MDMLEGKFWRETVKPNVVGFWKRIESPSTGSGTPDCVALVGRCTSWVELKSKNTLEDGLGTTAIQRHFLDRWIEKGGTSYLLARVGGEVLFLSGRGIPRTASMEAWRQLALLHGPRTEFDWSKMGELMAQGFC